MLDQEMLESVSGVSIASRPALIRELPVRNGIDVAQELRGRLLLRYVLPSQVGMFGQGSRLEHWATPTPLAAEDVVSWLDLPSPSQPRTHVMLLDPAKIEAIQGPKWVRHGQGIEYFLPRGFPAAAILQPWEIELR